jgi:hypothetical protein
MDLYGSVARILSCYDPYLKRLLVLVPVGVVEAEGLVDGRALVHELDGAAGISRNVANGQKSVRQMR